MDRYWYFEDDECGSFAVCALDEEHAVEIATREFDNVDLSSMIEITGEELDWYGLDVW